MQQLGISPYLASQWLASVVFGTPYSAPGFYYQLHNGWPGGDFDNLGTLNLSIGAADRQAAIYGYIDDVTTDLIDPLPTWQVIADDTLSFLSGWDEVVGGNCLGIGRLPIPAIVRTGDVHELDSYPLNFLFTASD